MKMKRHYLVALLVTFMAAGCTKETEHGEKETEGKSLTETTAANETSGVVAPGAKLEKLATGFGWAEGPAVNSKGTLFFTDVRGNTIHTWTPDRGLSTFLENSGGADGLYFDGDGSLLSAAGNIRGLISIDSLGKITVLADTYNNKKFNFPNDLWVDPKGGVYFSDHRYSPLENPEIDGDHVYYLTPDRTKVIRVINDMVYPNGVLGTPDGKLLYVLDCGPEETYVYTINEDGTLSNKTFFAPEGIDGITMDTEGNVYLTTEAVTVYDSDGNKIDEIEIPEHPSNVCFGGEDKQTLFITATSSLYSIRTRIKGL